MAHLCPRRREGGPLSDPAKTGPDKYVKGHGLVGQKSGCSYCGSLSPQDFMHAVVNGAVVGPTDKSYKFYLSEAVTEEDCAADRQRRIDRYVSMGIGLEEATAVVDRDSLPPHGKDLGKFYTQHFSESQGWEFWNLHQLGKVAWGYPGYPYVGLYIPGPSTQKADE